MTDDQYKIDKARQLYEQAGGKIKQREIAEAVGVSRPTIARWKANGWKFKVPRDNKGRQNARGHGAPRGAENCFKTGEYKAIMWNTLTADEQSIYNQVPDDPMSLLLDSIRIMRIRERRMLENLERVKTEEKIITEELSHIAIERGDSVDSPTLREHTKRKQALIDKIVMIEEALTRVQEKTVRAVDSLYRMQKEQKAQAGSASGSITFTFDRGEVNEI